MTKRILWMGFIGWHIFSCPAGFAQTSQAICSSDVAPTLLAGLTTIAKDELTFSASASNCDIHVSHIARDKSHYASIPVVRITGTSVTDTVLVYPNQITQLIPDITGIVPVSTYQELSRLLDNTQSSLLIDYLTLSQLVSDGLVGDRQQYVTALSVPLWMTSTQENQAAALFASKINQWNLSLTYSQNLNPPLKSLWRTTWFWLIVTLAIVLFIAYRYYLLALQSVTLDSKNYELELKNQELQGLKNRLQQRNQDLEFLSTHDPLTGLLNRAYFEQSVSREQNRAKRTLSPLSIILLDLDWFKSVNDKYGHVVGDQVLIAVAKELTRQLRSVDVIARWGGEEFIILLPDTPLHYAFELAERLRENIYQLIIPPVGQVSASFGVAECDLKEQFADVFIRADKAMYQAKKVRNQVIASEFELV